MRTGDITELVQTSHPAVPQIYAYTTPGVPAHDGWTKIGYTEQKVEDRIRQQSHTIDVECHLEWNGNALYEDGSGTFRDADFHGYLRKLEYEGKRGTEWFKISPADSHGRFYEFRENKGVLGDTPEPIDYRLRDEQKRAVEAALDYARLHVRGEFLWNAKPRFGKTLATYDLCKRLKAQKVLIVTNRPAIANSWYDDYVKFIGTAGGYWFVSSTDAVAGRKYCLSREDYRDRLQREEEPTGCIEFVSLQDLKGSIRFGGKHDKLKEVADLEWDILVIDEAHEGVDTIKTDVAFDHINRKFTLHLSGTPFKAIANEKFPEDAIFNWTYADEQKAKRDWSDLELPNPYADLPRLNLFTYRMSDIIENEIQQGMDLDGETVDYAFDLNEFFVTDGNGSFIHADDVKRFLNALTTQRKFPFSTPELRDELRHTFWMLNRVDSAKALGRMLGRHPIFKDYKVIVAAGDGKLDDEDENRKALDEVREAIEQYDKTITLSVGQLTTGVTVPEWTGVLMLSNMKSPALYMQTAFRAQNPCLFHRDGKFLRKENAYVFDFDPARTLIIFEEFANDLYSDTAAGGGDADARKQRVRTLLNFFPVLGEDENGEMIELDAERVLSIPRAIRSREVVRRGFMCDFLFQNISNVFHAPASVVNIIQRFEPIKGKTASIGIDSSTADDLSLNDEGEVTIPEERVIGTANDLFGEKIYVGISDQLGRVIDSLHMSPGTKDEEDETLKRLSDAFITEMKPLTQAAREHYGDDLKTRQKQRIERRIQSDVEIRLNREIGAFKIERNKIEMQRQKDLETVQSEEEAGIVNGYYDDALSDARNKLVDNLKTSRGELVEEAGKTIVREVETAKKENQKETIEDKIRDHLRGFSRTIPSFLMAYGDEDTTLENFDRIIPPGVFHDVTGVTVEDFRLLRDGGDTVNPETGVVEYFNGHLFDPVVFDDSVREFIQLRTKLVNYFDESQTEDIFDYVPPQKTNQIFTPRRVVVQMIDMFEEENPGCFDDPDHTFADLYMKSGMYITEIIKRLYNSERMKELFPDDRTRLDHILEKQVFGLAPTEIIYQIATHYILGYHNEIGNGCSTNFAKADAAELAKEGKLAEFVEKTFGDKLD